MGGGAKNSTQTAAPSGERRQVTVLFADMVGFVEVSERIGEDATFSLIRQIYELLTAAIKDQGGWAKDFTGDGVMALFGASEALEDAPLRACRSGLSIYQRLAAAASTFESQYGSRPQMRIGVNSGLAVVARIFSQDAAVTALGDTVNLASRLQKLAEPGTVYLSESTRRLVEGQAETVFAGEFDIKGKSEPQKVYRLELGSAGRHPVRNLGLPGAERLCRTRARVAAARAQLGGRAAESLHHRCGGRTGHGEVAVAL